MNKCKQPLKIGIMGGTFDPIHYGHLVTAEIARAKFNLDTVIFVPAGRPPHKEIEAKYSEHRYMMTFLATVTNPYFQISRLELEREGLSYTYDTLCRFKEEYGADCQLHFITGADAIRQIFTWNNAEQLFGLCNFIAATRPGYQLAELADWPPNFKDKIKLMQVPALSISSTDIRRRIKNGQPIKYLLPESVENYIRKQGLYWQAEAE